MIYNGEMYLRSCAQGRIVNDKPSSRNINVVIIPLQFCSGATRIFNFCVSIWPFSVFPQPISLSARQQSDIVEPLRDRLQPLLTELLFLQSE